MISTILTLAVIIKSLCQPNVLGRNEFGSNVFAIHSDRKYLYLAAGLAIIFGFNVFSANLGRRWVFPFQNVLAGRILTDRNATHYFARCGMPVTPALTRLAGGKANSEDRAFYNDPDLEGYRVWLKDNGKSCYIRWLFSRPVISLIQPLHDFEKLIVFENIGKFFSRKYSPIHHWFIAKIVYPDRYLYFLWIATTCILIVALWKKAWKYNKLWIVYITLNLLVYPHLFIVWHGDTWGIDRHALSVSVQFILCWWIMVLLICDTLLSLVWDKG
jgi:hypothetical protein